jgi:hypothetical protein
MSVTASLPADAAQLLFADWGVPLTLRQVSAAYDPQSGELQETFIDTLLSAVPGGASQQAAPHTAGQHLVEERTFLVRSTDLPESVSPASARLIHTGREYRLLGIDRSAVGDLVVLRVCTAGN